MENPTKYALTNRIKKDKKNKNRITDERPLVLFLRIYFIFCVLQKMDGPNPKKKTKLDQKEK